MSSDIEIPPVLDLPDGLVGLPGTRRLDVLPIARGDFVELIDEDDPSLGWLAAAADDVRSGMTDTLRSAGLIDDDELLLVLLASHGDPIIVTANLAGPLVVSPTGEARQIVLEDPSFEVRAQLGRLAPNLGSAG